MTRFEYINALRQALEGLPAETIAATITDYERRIYQESAAGKSEEEIIAGLEDPQAVGAERRAKLQMQAFKKNKTPTNFFRMCFSLIGLMIFNLFLIIPTIVYSALLFAAYCVSLAFYVGGVAVTAISIAGVSEVALNPTVSNVSVQHAQIAVNDKDNHVRIEIDKDGKTASASIVANAPASASATASAASSTTPAGTAGNPVVKVGPNSVRIADGPNQIHISDDGDDDDAAFDGDDHGVHIDLPGLHIYNPDYSDHVFLATDALGASRPLQFIIGLGLILGGIVAFLVCLAISRFSIIGMWRLAQMEIAVLKSA